MIIYSNEKTIEKKQPFNYLYNEQIETTGGVIPNESDESPQP